MKKVSLLLFVLILSLTANGISHNSFRHFLSKDGLPINTVTCSTSDHLGYLWFGTRDGICRFDGAEFTVLECNGPECPASGLVFSLSEDKEGRLWFCTVNGTGYYDINKGEITAVPELPAVRFNDITEDGKGNIWFTSEGTVFMKDYKTGEYSSFDNYPASSTLRSSSDGKGGMWFTSSSGGLFRFDADISAFSEIICLKGMIQGEHPECITSLDNSHLVLSTNQNRLLLFDIKTEEAITLTEVENHINCVMAKSSVEIWIGTSEGTMIYDRLKDEIHPVYQTSGTEITKNITCIVTDAEGNVWTGSYYGGLNVWNNQEHSITRLYDTGKNSCLKGHLAHAFASDGDGYIWIGTEDGFLNKIKLSDYSSSRIVTSGLPDDLNIHGMLFEDGILWIASYNRGLFLLDVSKGTCTRHSDSPSDACVCLYRLKDGTILLGTDTGLFRYDATGNSFEQIKGTGKYFIHSICQDTKGRIWLGTFGNGLFRSDDTLVSFSSVNPECSECSSFSDYTTFVFEDSSGNMWIASDGTGIHKLSPDGAFLSHLTRNSGLPSNIVTAITQDKDGDLWVSTTKGLAVLDSGTSEVKKTFMDYSETTGNQYINGAGLALPDGRIFFGTTNGVITFNPASIIDPLSDAPLYFSSITTEGNKKKYSVTENGLSTTFTKHIKLKERDAAHLSISFSAPYFADLFTPQYETVLLRGKKELTHTVTDENTVSFTRLRPGKYTLNVQLVGSTNPESSKSLSIRIVPPLHESFASILLYFALFIAAVFEIIKLVVSKRISEEERKFTLVESQKQKEISESKLDFMTEITHEIRTPLSLIKMPIEKIINENDYTETSREDIFTIKANTDRLMELTDKFIEVRTKDEIPASQEKSAAPETGTTEEQETEDSGVSVENSGKPTILIVEDEPDMRLYLTRELSSLYNISDASNGEEAVEIIKESRVDLVVSDIMMPLMDGCQLCNFIKSNVEYSHIPVILLTAVVGVETRIETLESGADGYIEKPFKMELLKANIANLFRNKEISYRQFANSPLSHFKSTSSNKVENAFMEKLHSVVMKHLADQELGIDMLTDILGTSKTTLYRKIKSNTGLNTNEYIRLCRLKKAADMLSSQEYRINEVAYLTGFSSPSYFATSFQKQFNISPSAFVKNLK